MISSNSDLKPSIVLPYVDVQSSISQVLSEIRDGTVAAEDVWISVYRLGSPSVHGKVRLYEGEESGSVDVESRDGVDVSLIDQHSFSVSAPSLDVHMRVNLPRAMYSGLIKNGINSFDLSKTQDLYVVGGSNGVLKVGKLSTGEITRDLRGHVGDITHCRFFPSGEVILSCGSDMSLRIFSPYDGTNPRTFTHTRGVTGTCIEGVGRVIHSVSSDGFLKRWDVPTSSLSRDWVFNTPLTSCSSANVEGGVVYVGDESGNIQGVSSKDGEKTKFKDKVWKEKGGEVSVITTFEEENKLISGHRGGIIKLWDTRQPDDCLKTWRRNDADVASIVVNEKKDGLVVAGADGLPYGVSWEGQVVEEYSGCEGGIDSVHLQGNKVWVGGRYGALQCYVIT